MVNGFVLLLDSSVQLASPLLLQRLLKAVNEGQSKGESCPAVRRSWLHMSMCCPVSYGMQTTPENISDLAGLIVALTAALTAVQLSATIFNALFWFWSLQISAKVRVSHCQCFAGSSSMPRHLSDKYGCLPSCQVPGYLAAVAADHFCYRSHPTADRWMLRLHCECCSFKRR